MAFKDNDLLANLYSNITKTVEPSEDQLTIQAPTLSNTDLSKDQDYLYEAYKSVTKHACSHAAKGCDCDCCKECKGNQEPIGEAKKSGKPDYMDVDKDGNKKEPMKKALKDKGKKVETWDIYVV